MLHLVLLLLNWCSRGAFSVQILVLVSCVNVFGGKRKETNKGVNAQYNDDDDDGNDMDDGCWLQKHFQGIPRGGLRRIPQKVGARSRQ